MKQIFLLTALLFTGFMCGQKSQPRQNPAITPRLTITEPEKQPSPTAESLEVSRLRFQQLAAQCRKITMERNGSPEVVQPLNPTHDVLSKTNHPPQ